MHTKPCFFGLTKEHLIFLILIGVFIALICFAPHVYAGTDGQELKPAADKVSGLIGGWGGKLICFIALLFTIIGSVAKFNPYLVASCLGVCILSALGVAVVNASVTALI